jgi:hypothetical protein
MPSADDLFNQLVAANNRLEDIKGDLVDVKGAVNGVTAAVTLVNATLTNGFNQLVTLGQYANQALYQNDQQNDTIICLLEHISQNTCALLNEAAIQTATQIEMERDIDTLESMFATVNAGAALEAKRLHALAILYLTNPIIGDTLDSNEGNQRHGQFCTFRQSHAVRSRRYRLG